MFHRSLLKFWLSSWSVLSPSLSSKVLAFLHVQDLVIFFSYNFPFVLNLRSLKVVSLIKTRKEYLKSKKCVIENSHKSSELMLKREHEGFFFCYLHLGLSLVQIKCKFCLVRRIINQFYYYNKSKYKIYQKLNIYRLSQNRNDMVVVIKS